MHIRRILSPRSELSLPQLNLLWKTILDTIFSKPRNMFRRLLFKQFTDEYTCPPRSNSSSGVLAAFAPHSFGHSPHRPLGAYLLCISVDATSPR